MKNVLIFDDVTNKIIVLSKSDDCLDVSNRIANVLYNQDNSNCTITYRKMQGTALDTLINLLVQSA